MVRVQLSGIRHADHADHWQIAAAAIPQFPERGGGGVAI
jgi:hypothetical protein